MTIYCYVRVSDERSTLSGLSTEAQKIAALRYAETIDDTLAETRYPADEKHGGVYADYSTSAYSVRFAGRMAGRELTQVLKPGDHLIFFSIERGFRNTEDFLINLRKWMNRGVNVHFIREQFNIASANGQLLATIIAALAQWQSQVRSERRREASITAQEKREGTRPRRKKEVPKQDRIKPWKGLVLPEKAVEEKAVVGTIYSYARLSKLDGDARQSLDGQKTICDKHAAYLMASNPGLQRGDHFEDCAVSAYKIDLRRREHGSLMNQQLKSGDVVVVSRLDRAWRRLSDMLNTVQDWTKQGVTIYFCDMGVDTKSFIGKFFMQLLATFAELESSMKSMHTKQAIAAARALGRVCNPKLLVGTKAVNRRDSNGVMRKMLAFDHETIREMRVMHYLNTKRGWKYCEIFRFMEHMRAKREGRAPYPEYGLYRKFHPPVYPRWRRTHIGKYVRKFAELWPHAEDKHREYRRRRFETVTSQRKVAETERRLDEKAGRTLALADATT